MFFCYGNCYSCGLLNIINSDIVDKVGPWPMIEAFVPSFGSSPSSSGKWTSIVIEMALDLVSLHSIAPGPVLGLSYEEDTDTSVNITWNPPSEPTGGILAYFVEHGVYNKKSAKDVRVDASRPRYTLIQALGKYR